MDTGARGGNGGSGGNGASGVRGGNGGKAKNGLPAEHGPQLNVEIRPIYSKFYPNEELVFVQVTARYYRLRTRSAYRTEVKNYIFHQKQRFTITSVGGKGGAGGAGGALHAVSERLYGLAALRAGAGVVHVRPIAEPDRGL